LDLGRPTALLMVAVLHFQPDTERSAAIVQQYTAALAPGSYLVMSHAASAGRALGRVQGAADVFSAGIGGFYLRSQEEVAALFGNLRFVQPGLVNMTDWRPDPDDPTPSPDLHHGYAGIARINLT
jgi:hypothetical protein